ncbi:MAG: DNA cytosine methyltransferase [Planctomycetota bacterium]|nr:DNA cytosine methyltransferase [Planctomycetota bacterium]
MRIADLFCGAGGMSLGAFLATKLLRRQFEVVLAVEANERAAEIYEHNFSRFYPSSADSSFPSGSRLWTGEIERILDGDLNAPELTDSEKRIRSEYAGGGNIDLLMGGPPCQGHSDLNNHTRRLDSRNDLYGRMARAAKALRPTVLIIENVKQVVHDRGGVVARTLQALDGEYDVRPHVLRFETLGVPQRRHRHVLVGVHRDESPNDRHASLEAMLFGAAKATESQGPRSVDWAISDLRDRYEGEGKGFDQSTVPQPQNGPRLDWFQDNNGEFNLPDRLRPPCHRNKRHSYRAVYGRLDPDGPANTITTGYGSMGQGRYVHPYERRTITPREAARLQTFPDFFEFDVVRRRTAWARAIGNAVPPIGIREVVKALFKIS